MQRGWQNSGTLWKCSQALIVSDTDVLGGNTWHITEDNDMHSDKIRKKKKIMMVVYEDTVHYSNDINECNAYVVLFM